MSPSRFDAAADLSLEDSMAFGCDIVAGESKTVDPAPARLPDDFTVDKARSKSSKGIQRLITASSVCTGNLRYESQE